jgi:hypothetical protein
MRKSCSQLRNASQATARRGSRSDIQVWFDWRVPVLPYHFVTFPYGSVGAVTWVATV